MLTDTHAHLDFPEFEQDLQEVLARAAAAGVTRIITIGTSIESSQRAVALAEQHPNVFAAIGVHPNSAGEVESDFIVKLRELAENPRVVAIGETGLDYHRLPSRSMHQAAVATAALGNETQADLEAAVADGVVKKTQAEVFERQLDLAAELGLNVILHERDAWPDTVEILRPYAGRVRGVFHCWGKSIGPAQEALAVGHLVSFTGIVTFKNAPHVQDSAAQLPSGSFMVETDCPFLAPVPHRGKRCEPAYTREVAAKIAELRGVSLEQIAAETTAAADGFFRFAQ